MYSTIKLSIFMAAIILVGKTPLANAEQNNATLASDKQSQHKDVKVKPVYLVAQFSVTDVENYTELYAKPTVQQLIAVGAELLAMSRDPEVLEGKWDHKSTVIIKFPSMAVLKNWYSSKEYQEVKNIRISKLTDGGNMILVPAY